MGVTANYDHKSEFMLGNTRSGTLELTIDSRGLFYSVALPESRSDIYELVDRGDVAGSSFSFNVYDDVWDFVHGATLRTLVSGQLLDVGPTSTPAYTTSTATAYRSFARQFDADPAEVERDFRNGNTRRYFERTNIMPKPTDMPPRNVTEDRGGMDTDLERRRRKNKMAMDGDPHALNRPVGGDIDLALHRLELYRRKAEIDADAITALDRQRNVYRPPYIEGQRREQQAAILALATRRRVDQLHEAGYDHVVANVERGVQTMHPSAGPAVPVMTPRPRPANSGWLGT